MPKVLWRVTSSSQVGSKAVCAVRGLGGAGVFAEEGYPMSKRRSGRGRVAFARLVAGRWGGEGNGVWERESCRGGTKISRGFGHERVRWAMLVRYGGECPGAGREV